MPYEAIVEAVGDGKGFINGNFYGSRQVEQVNSGVITEYPYEIGEVIPVSLTHGQYFQLAMEDEDVTVWYTLKDSGITDGGGSIAYGVSPRDAANNYYIYSKGNVFYSGVGHSKVTVDEEIKLFVNTMIAAYRTTNEPPEVLISNTEAINTGGNNYTIEVPRAFNSLADDTGNNVQQQEEFVDSTYKVYFTPKEYNLRYTATVLTCTVYYVEDGTNKKIPITTIYDSAGNAYTNPNGVFTVEDEKKYYFVYENKYMDANTDTGEKSRRKVQLEIKNNKVNDSTTTTVTMSVEPFFQLD